MFKNAKYIVIVFICLTYIAKSQCNNIFYKAHSCISEFETITQNPIAEGCMRWLQNTPNEPIKIKFQNRISAEYPQTFIDTMDFSINEVETYLNWAMLYWASQCQSPGFYWDTTEQGALIGWEEDPMYFISNPDAPFIVNHSLDSNDLTSIVDSSGCSPSSILGRTEILFNNSEEFYTRNPHLRWSTDMKPINSWLNVKLDVRSLILHAVGHYLGIADDTSDINGIMNPNNIGKVVALSQCDADKLRMLYCQSEVGNPVGVEEQKQDISEVINLELFPIPNTGIVSIGFDLPLRDLVKITLSDILGTTIEIVANEIFWAGKNEVKYSTANLSDGVYIINLFCGNKYYSEKLLIIK